MAACIGTANTARLNNAGHLFWPAIAAGAIQTPISSHTQGRQINITESVTFIRSRFDTYCWASAELLLQNSKPPNAGKRFHRCGPYKLRSRSALKILL